MQLSPTSKNSSPPPFTHMYFEIQLDFFLYFGLFFFCGCSFFSFCLFSACFCGADLASASRLALVSCHYFHLKARTVSRWLGCSILNMVYVSEHVFRRMGLVARWILSVHSVNVSSLVSLLGISVIRSWDLNAMSSTLHTSLILSTLVFFNSRSWNVNFPLYCRMSIAWCTNRKLFVPFSVLKGEFSFVLQDVNCMMHKLNKGWCLLRIMSSVTHHSFHFSTIAFKFFFLMWSYFLQIGHVCAVPGVHSSAAAYHRGVGSDRNCQCVRCDARVLTPILCRTVQSSFLRDEYNCTRVLILEILNTRSLVPLPYLSQGSKAHK